MKVAALLLALLVLSSGFLESTAEDDPAEFCKTKCGERCSKAKLRKKRCLRKCESCCEACKCVPSGTSGNKDECPCYRDMKKIKCP